MVKFFLLLKTNICICVFEYKSVSHQNEDIVDTLIIFCYKLKVFFVNPLEARVWDWITKKQKDDSANMFLL